jgi:hypothetical protein
VMAHRQKLGSMPLALQKGVCPEWH